MRLGRAALLGAWCPHSTDKSVHVARARGPAVDSPPASNDELGQPSARTTVEVQPGISCPSCGHANRPDRRFCTECGRRLGRACAACGTTTEAEEKFCGNCGAPLGEQAAAARAPAAYTPKHLADRILAEQAAMES